MGFTCQQLILLQACQYPRPKTHASRLIRSAPLIRIIGTKVLGQLKQLFYLEDPAQYSSEFCENLLCVSSHLLTRDDLFLLKSMNNRRRVHYLHPCNLSCNNNRQNNNFRLFEPKPIQQFSIVDPINRSLTKISPFVELKPELLINCSRQLYLLIRGDAPSGLCRMCSALFRKVGQFRSHLDHFASLGPIHPRGGQHKTSHRHHIGIGIGQVCAHHCGKFDVYHR